MLTIRNSIAPVLVVGALALFSARPTVAQSKSINEVWAREQAAWKFAKAGDVENYVALFDERYTGWPCGYPRPATGSTIGDWVREIRDTKAKFTYDLKLEGTQDFGDIVVVVYSTPIASEYPDGRTWGVPGRYKITHTWRRLKNTWIAIGGMCGQPEQPNQ